MTIHARFEHLVTMGIDFDLTPAEQTDLDNHLATCPACRALAAAYRSDASSLRTIAFAEPPARVRSALLAATVRPGVRTSNPWKLLAAAALLVGLTIGAALVGSMLMRRSTPLGNGPLIVYQIRGEFADIFTLDIASGVQVPLGSIQLNAPIGGQRIQWTADGRSAFVFGAEPALIQARVDVVSQAIVPLGLSIDAETDAVSPGGDRVARLGGDTESGQHLSIIDLGGKELLAVPLPVGGWVSSEMEWAPDGISLLLSGCMPCDLDAKQSSIDRQHLFLVSLDGSPIRQLTDDPTGFGNPRFSPDGLTVAYSTATCADPCPGGIATVGMANGRISQLTTSGPDLWPAWSPDGDRIVFERGGAGGGIFVMDRDGSNPVRLTTASPGVGGDRMPFWSPNGAWIAFTRVTSETSLGDLWIVPSHGGDERQLVQNAVADWGPTTTMLAGLPAASPSALPPAPPSARPLVSASTSAVPAGSPAASGPIPLGGSLLLVFQVDGTTNANATTQSVFLVDIESGERTKLGSLPLTDATCCPNRVQWSADRQQVILSSELGVQAIVDLRAGTVEAAAAAPPGQFKAAISRRGDRIARVDEVTGIAPTIVISDLSSRELARLRVPVLRSIDEMSWSPEDMTLAVIGCGPCEGGSEPTTVTHLLLVPVDGSPARDLADNAAEVAAAPALLDRERRWDSYGGAAWSPDGGTIALADVACVSSSTRRIVNGIEVRERYACTGRLLSVDVANGEQTVVMQDQGVPRSPSWSPDGRRLAFGQFANSGDFRDRQICYPCDRLGLYVIDRDGSHLTRLADGDSPVAWSPDGSWLAFLRFDWDLPEDAFRSEVWVVPAAGGPARLIAHPAAAGW